MAQSGHLLGGRVQFRLLPASKLRSHCLLLRLLSSPCGEGLRLPQDTSHPGPPACGQPQGPISTSSPPLVPSTLKSTQTSSVELTQGLRFPPTSVHGALLTVQGSAPGCVLTSNAMWAVCPMVSSTGWPSGALKEQATCCPPAPPTLINSILHSFRLMSRTPVPPCSRTTTIFFGKVLDARDKRNPLLHRVCFTQGEVWCFPHWSSRPPTDTLSNISSIQQRYQLPLPGLSTEPGL